MQSLFHSETQNNYALAIQKNVQKLWRAFQQENLAGVCGDLEGYFEEGRSESFQPPQGPDVHFDRHFSVPTHLQLQAGHRGVPR